MTSLFHTILLPLVHYDGAPISDCSQDQFIDSGNTTMVDMVVTSQLKWKNLDWRGY